MCRQIVYATKRKAQCMQEHMYKDISYSTILRARKLKTKRSLINSEMDTYSTPT